MEKVYQILQSKIVWTQAVSLVAVILAVWGIPLDPASQSVAVTVIVTVASALTAVLRAWFNK